MVWRMRLALLLAAVAVTAACTSPTPTPSPVPAGSAVDNTRVTYDVLGARLDAHDGTVVQDPAGTVWLFGTSYGCGFQLGLASPWCGVRVYRSTDLQTWAPAGAVGGILAFDPYGPGWQSRCSGDHFGCFRPHVARRPDGTWVMWVNVAHSTAGYAVLTAAAPGGPYTEVPTPPRLAVSDGSVMPFGDEDITADPARPGVAWVAYTVIDHSGGGSVHDIAVEQLDPTWTTGTGRYVRLHRTLVEAPGLFSRGGRWYLVYSDPACPYCVTSAGWAHAPSPLGPWTAGPAKLTACVGQPADVSRLRRPSGTDVWVYQTDRWAQGTTLVRNQYRANNYLAPLAFTADGSPTHTCTSAWTFGP